MVLKPCVKDYMQSADRTLAGPAALEGTGRILLIKLSAGGAALPQHNAPAVSISEYQNRSYRNIYEPLIYKWNQKLQSSNLTQTQIFRGWGRRVRTSTEKAAGADPNGVCHVEPLPN